MVMAEYFIHDRLKELWSEIHRLHLTYLHTEDSPQKIEQRDKLEVCIREYLSIAPHGRKWCCPETAAVLRVSASRRDFSGYRAATAFSALAMYAGNLLAQPWRNEYKQIKTYCGFYKHQISANLFGAEALFEALGYRNAGSGVLVFEGPVCPDQVANVSQDSIVAFVECQILKSIWEDVSSSFKITWLDVLEFRESHISSCEQASRMLKYRLQERRYQEQYAALPVRYYPPPPQCVYSHPPPCYYPVPLPVPVPHYHSVPPPQHQLPIMRCNGYCYQTQPCPTGQLIELDATPQNGQCHYEMGEPHKLTSLESHKALAKSTNLDSLTLSKSREDGAGTFESWDYVYRNLESQGYYRDLAERPDVTRAERAHQRRSTARPSRELEDQLDGLGLGDRVHQSASLDNMPHEVNGVESKSHIPPTTNTIKSQPPTTSKSQPVTLKPHSNTLKSHTPTKSQPSTTKPLATTSTAHMNGHSKESPSPSPLGLGWNCNTCTFLNAGDVEVCTMCGKSRRGAGAETPLQVGGAQCPRCTLVNQRDAKRCQACDASLHNSPTYI